MHSPRKYLCLLAFALSAAQPVSAAPMRDFPLGQTAGGAVCSAVLNEDDPATGLGSKAWDVRCLGFDGVFGHLYAFGRNGAAAVAPGGNWDAALQERADCAPAISDASGINSRTCKFRGGRSLGYSALSWTAGDRSVAADGMDSIRSLLLLGVKILTDQAPVPGTTAVAGDGGGIAAMNDAASVLLEASGTLRARGHLENKGWQFADAERDFRQYAASGKLTDEERVYARFDIALNLSNQGQDYFARADRLFADAVAETARLHDRQADAMAWNYQALHFLNERRFADAIAAAQKGIALRLIIDPSIAYTTQSVAIEPTSSGSFEVTAALADGFNIRNDMLGFHVLQLSTAEQLALQNAQAYYVIGAAKGRQEDRGGAQAAFDQVLAILNSGRLAKTRSTAWLLAEVYGALGDLDLRAHQGESARAQYQHAIDVSERLPSLVASPAQANLYFDRGRASAATGQTDLALADFKKGFDMHRHAHQALGDARNLAATYFDLLLERVANDPAHATGWQQDYFDASQVIAAQGTAQTLAELAAGSSSDPLAEQYARNLKEERRQIAILEEDIFHQQDTGGVAPELRAQEEADLQKAQDQARTLEGQLLEKNPKYGQVVEETATLAKLQAELRAGEVYVKTTFLANRGYGIAVTHDMVQTYPIALTRIQAAAEVAALRKPFDGKLLLTFDVPQAHTLFATIFGPAQDIVRHASHLIYEPDSVMVGLPAATFVTDDASVARFSKARARMRRMPNGNLYDNVAWLGRTTGVSLTVSTEAFLHSRVDLKPSSRPRGFVGFGDPVTQGYEPRRYALLTDPRYAPDMAACSAERVALAQNLESLAPINGTIQAVAAFYGANPNDVVLQAPFSDDAVMARSDLNQYRVVFFGTHGLLPSNDLPCLPMPVLVTSLGDGAQSDGLLDATEILKLNLDADMVVLAACDTGTTTERTGTTGLGGSGDSLNGLARDFIYAGARSLLVSQWKVDADATAILMTKTLTSDAPSQAEALRKAEVALMDTLATSHPYYWAAFSLVGDGNKPMPSHGQQTAAR